MKLFVVKKDSTLSEEDTCAFCKENFTAYKRPKYIEFRDELPKTNVGKILRRELRTFDALVVSRVHKALARCPPAFSGGEWFKGAPRSTSNTQRSIAN